MPLDEQDTMEESKDISQASVSRVETSQDGETAGEMFNNQSSP